MKITVQKYGGSSVATIQKIKNVALKIKNSIKPDNKLVVVVSAMGDTTDRLIDMAKDVCDLPSKRELDQLMATGEQVSIALVAMALHQLGVSAISLTGPQAGIKAKGNFTEGRICAIYPDRVVEELNKNDVVLVAGFQAITEDGKDIITLGRGGSDLTAVAIAAALNACACHIYTDVVGIFTADPRVVRKARKLPFVSYEECMEMAVLGAKVLQARSVELAARYNVPIYVASTFLEEEGTWVKGFFESDKNSDFNSVNEGLLIKAVTHDKNIAKVAILGVPDRPGIAAYVFEKLSESGITADMIIQSVMRGGINDIAFIIKESDLGYAIEICKKIVKDLGAQGVIFDSEVARVAIVGAGIANHSDIPAKMFSTLAKEGINIDMISSTGMSISCVVNVAEVERAVNALHKKFIEEGS